MIESGTWSVLFTDIVGSTEVRSRLGDDAADVLFSRLDAAVSSAIDAHQGVLVKGLGDGHMAAFRGAADAIGAAVEIQQAACREQLIVLRVGISAGDAGLRVTTCSARRWSKRRGCARRRTAGRSSSRHS